MDSPLVLVQLVPEQQVRRTDCPQEQVLQELVFSTAGGATLLSNGLSVLG